ncbi:MAG: hypothetical protein HYT28_01955 [Parcubacteria group bacterium]|nr:hypothetical protein [Parcubacteria group bacterium]
MNTSNIQKKSDDVVMANKHQVHLLDNIDKAQKSLSLFELLRNKKFTTGTVKQDNWLEEILLSFIILKIHTVFDKTRDTVCFENFLKNNAQHITKKKYIEDISSKFEALKTKHKTLIEQIKNNRHESVAHIPKKTKLGVTEKVAVKIREFGHQIGSEDYKNQKSVSDDKMRFSVGNFPIDNVKDLTTKLLKLIFGVKYPKTIGKLI